MGPVVPFLWFAEGVEDAVRFYTSLLPDSRIDSVTPMPTDTPSGPPGSVIVVEFTLMGAPYVAMQAGPMDPFNHAVSFMVLCDTQAEVDRLWEALGEGGAYEACGWLRDRWGVSWQITPRVHMEHMRSPDRAAVKRAADAMLTMTKLDVAKLTAAFEGRDEPAAA